MFENPRFGIDDFSSNPFITEGRGADDSIHRIIVIQQYKRQTIRKQEDNEKLHKNLLELNKIIIEQNNKKKNNTQICLEWL